MINYDAVSQYFNKKSLTDEKLASLIEHGQFAKLYNIYNKNYHKEKL